MFSDSLHSATRGEPLLLAPDTDDAWLNGGLRVDGVHEFYAAAAGDAPTTTAFALLLASMRQRHDRREVAWLREAKAARRGGDPYGPGLAELGVPPQALALIVVPDARAVLRAAVDSVRDGSLSAILVELAGKQPLLDLTATRRLALAAAENETTVLLARGHAAPAPSAAHSRWRVAAAPSRALEANAPGPPAFFLELLRQRGGRDGLQLTMEWDRDAAIFRHLQAGEGQPAAPAPLSRPQPAVATGGAADTRRARAG